MTALYVGESLFQLLVDAALRGTLLLAGACLATLALRRSSAAVRHRVWSLTMLGLVLLPALSWLLPTWRLPLLPAVLGSGTTSHSSAYSDSTVPLSGRFPGEAPQDEQVAFARSAVSETGMPANDVDGEKTSAMALWSHAGMLLRTISGDLARWVSFGTAIVWTLGATLFLAGVARGVWGTDRQRRAAQSIGDETWKLLLIELCARLGVRRSVDLREHSAPVVPSTWGLLRPIVVVPPEARGWSAKLRRAVLLHELAHVHRNDIAYQLLGHIACSLYWFHPLAWFGLRQLRLEREQACDDAVIESGERASDYAEQLLEVARRCRCPGGLSLVIAISHGGNLENRVRALFDASRSHAPVSRRGAFSLAAAVAVMVSAIAILRPVSAESAAVANELDPAPATAPTPTETPTATEENGVPTGTAANPVSNRSFEIKGRCLDDKGDPLDGAEVTLLQFEGFGAAPIQKRNLKTGPSGEYHFANLMPLPESESEVWPDHYIVVASKPNHASSGWSVFSSIKRTDFDLTLARAVGTLSGRVTNAQGLPLEGVEVYHALGGGIPIPGFKYAVTDKEGRYSIYDLKRWNAEDKRTLKARPEERRAEISHYFFLKHPDYPLTSGVYTEIPQKVDIQLNPGMAIEGRVIDGATGESAAMIVVTAQGIKEGGWAQVTTDQKGMYRLRLTPDQYNITARARDRTSVALDSFAGEIGQTKKAPDLVLITGGFLVGKVIDKHTGKLLIRLPNNQRVAVAHHGPAFPPSGSAVGSALVADDGTYRLRVAPGDNFPYLMHDMHAETRPRVAGHVTVGDGETVELDFYSAAPGAQPAKP